MSQGIRLNSQPSARNIFSRHKFSVCRLKMGDTPQNANLLVRYLIKKHVWWSHLIRDHGHSTMVIPLHSLGSRSLSMQLSLASTSQSLLMFFSHINQILNNIKQEHTEITLQNSTLAYPVLSSQQISPCCLLLVHSTGGSGDQNRNLVQQTRCCLTPSLGISRLTMVLFTLNFWAMFVKSCPRACRTAISLACCWFL